MSGKIFTDEDVATMKASITGLWADDTIEDYGDGESGPCPYPVEGTVSNLDRFIDRLVTWRGDDDEPRFPQQPMTPAQRRGYNDYHVEMEFDMTRDHILGVVG